MEDLMETSTRTHTIVRSDEVLGVKVINSSKEDLGKIHEIVLDKTSGQVKYLVLESGSFLGLGGKFFAIPWNSIHYNPDEEAFILNVSKEKLKNAPGFDKNHWPEFSDDRWGKSITDYYSNL